MRRVGVKAFKHRTGFVADILLDSNNKDLLSDPIATSLLAIVPELADIARKTSLSEGMEVADVFYAFE